MTSTMRDEELLYPFRFYGHRPKSWSAGGRQEHHYRLCFTGTPDEEQRESLAAAAASPRLAPVAEPLQWAGQWALLAVGESDDADFFFDDVEDLLLRLHDLLPLAEAVYLEAEDLSDSEWEDWSLNQQPQPAPGPTFGRESALFEAPAPEPEPEPEPEWIPDPSPPPASAAEPGHDVWEGRLTLEPREPREVLGPQPLPPEVSALLEPGDFTVAGEGAVIVRCREGAYDAADRVVNGEPLPLALPEGFGPIEAAAVSANGGRALLCDRSRICCLELPAGDLTVAWEAEPELLICSAAFAANGSVVASTFAGLLLLAPQTDGGLEAVSSYPCSPGTVIPYAGGRLLMVEANDPALEIFAVRNGELEAVAAVEGDVRLLYVVGERVFGRGTEGYLEVTEMGRACAALS